MLTTTTTRKVCLARATHTHTLPVLPMASPGLPVSLEVWSATSVRQERVCQHQLVDGILHSMRSEFTAAEDKKYTCVNRVKIISGVNFFLR